MVGPKTGRQHSTCFFHAGCDNVTQLIDLNLLGNKTGGGSSTTATPQDWKAQLEILAKVVSDEMDADVFLHTGTIERGQDLATIDTCRSLESRRPNAILMLCTYGGAPDVAYRIARCFQRHYTKFTVLTDGICASAGTLLAFGASELVMSEYSALGPLDMQIAKADELWEMSSGLTGQIALEAVRHAAFETFERCLIQLKADLPNQVSLKTAMDVAVKLTTGLFAEVYNQIDPLKLGEDRRAVEVAEHYGARLNTKHKNAKPNTLQKLLATYPSHSFVIDIEESTELFERVRTCTPSEASLTTHLKEFLRTPSATPRLCLLSEPKTTEDNIDDHGKDYVETPNGGISKNGSNNGQASHAVTYTPDGAGASGEAKSTDGAGSGEEVGVASD